MAKALKVGDEVAWYTGLVRNLDRTRVRTFNGGVITRIDGDLMLIFTNFRSTPHGGCAVVHIARHVKGRWVALGAGSESKPHRIYRRS